MLSLRARLFLFVLRNRHLLKGRLRPDTGADWEHDLDRVRAEAAKSSRLMGKLPQGVRDLPVEAPNPAPVPAAWLIPENAPEGKVLLYFRGGGYVLGDLDMHKNITAKFAQGTGLRTLLFDYRRAPEHPYPAALDDSLTVYRWLRGQGYAAKDVVLCGDSAGGGLLLAMLLTLKDAGEELPAGAAALSPWTDVACTGESVAANSRRCLAPRLSWLACQKHYTQGQDATQPYISPLYGDLSGLPPLLLYCGEYETLRDDSVRFHDKALAAGVDSRLHVGSGMCHCYPACAPIFPEATRALADICGFLKNKAMAA